MSNRARAKHYSDQAAQRRSSYRWRRRMQMAMTVTGVLPKGSVCLVAGRRQDSEQVLRLYQSPDGRSWFLQVRDRQDTSTLGLTPTSKRAEARQWLRVLQSKIGEGVVTRKLDEGDAALCVALDRE